MNEQLILAGNQNPKIFSVSQSNQEFYYSNYGQWMVAHVIIHLIYHCVD